MRGTLHVAPRQRHLVDGTGLLAVVAAARLRDRFRQLILRRHGQGRRPRYEGTQSLLQVGGDDRRASAVRAAGVKQQGQERRRGLTTRLGRDAARQGAVLGLESLWMEGAVGAVQHLAYGVALDPGEPAPQVIRQIAGESARNGRRQLRLAGRARPLPRQQIEQTAQMIRGLLCEHLRQGRVRARPVIHAGHAEGDSPRRGFADCEPQLAELLVVERSGGVVHR